MSRPEGFDSLLQKQVTRVELLSAVRHALDAHYRHLCQAARADWERLIGSDPADACVTVRVSADQPATIRGSGFLKSRRAVSKSHGKNSVPRFAH
jgi:hypothetical protein